MEKKNLHKQCVKKKTYQQKIPHTPHDFSNGPSLTNRGLQFSPSGQENWAKCIQNIILPTNLDLYSRSREKG